MDHWVIFGAGPPALCSEVLGKALVYLYLHMWLKAKHQTFGLFFCILFALLAINNPRELGSAKDAKRSGEMTPKGKKGHSQPPAANHVFTCNCPRCRDVDVDLDFTEVFVCSAGDCGGLMRIESDPGARAEAEADDGECLLACQWCDGTRLVDWEQVERVEGHLVPWRADA